MPIPEEILKVERPINTRVKKNGNKYDVIKRTSVYKDGRRVPKELGKIGEIIDYKYVECKKNIIPSMSFDTVDIKEYGRIALCHLLSSSILDELKNEFSEDDAINIYVMAILRSSYEKLTNRDMKYYYDTSYLSELFPSASTSESSICSFLELLGRNYNKLKNFMQNRIDNRDKDSITIVDGMLKDTTGEESDYVQWSRKSRLKGTKEISLLYAFDSTLGEPLCHKVYPGNMLDMTSFKDFIQGFNLENCIIMGDKGFLSKENVIELKSKNNLNFILPLKRSDARIDKFNLLSFQGTFLDEDDVIEYSKTKGNDGNYYYCFRSNFDSNNERKGYLINVEKNKNYNNENFEKKERTFGVICFESDKDLDPKEVYFMYEKRWEIETFFGFYKNIVGLSKVRVQGDLSIIGSEFINMLSSIISLRVKRKFKEEKLNEKYSYRQLMQFLDQIKKVKISESKWIDTNTIKYIDEIKKKLCL